MNDKYVTLELLYIGIGVMNLLALGAIGFMINSALEIYKVDKSAIVHNLKRRKENGNKKS